MPIISIRHNENNKSSINAKKTTTRTTRKRQRQKRRSGDRSYSERVRAKWFCCAFKLGFLQLICKSCLIFKSNKRIIWTKACCSGV